MEITCVDRISELPEPIQQQILSLLSQNDAARICALSKTWLQHWFTRPNVEFRQQTFDRKTFSSILNKTLQRYRDQHISIHEFNEFIEKSLREKEKIYEPVVDRTLQRYLDQNLSIHEFRLHVSNYYDRKPAAELLRKWIPKLKIFNIYLSYEEELLSCCLFDIPSSVFEAESLQKLYLERCKLNQKCVVNVLCKHLKTLHLEKVKIADEAFNKIISSCPLIENVTFFCCGGLSVVKVDNKLHNLKQFEFTTSYSDNRRPSIEIDVPSSVIERIKIKCCPILFRNEYQRNLKSLSLTGVRLSSELFDLFSCKMPSLEFLEFVSCYGFKEFHLSSRSIKHLSFDIERLFKVDRIFKATIDAPNILCFKYSSFYLPSLFSFTTTNSSHEWKSKLILFVDDTSFFLKLYQLLEELSSSEISLFLYINMQLLEQEITEIVLLQDKKPLVVEHLNLQLSYRPTASHSDFVNQLFRICHPRILVCDEDSDDFLRKFLRKRRHYFWGKKVFPFSELEDVSMETYAQCRHRFRLKWREI